MELNFTKIVWLIPGVSVERRFVQSIQHFFLIVLYLLFMYVVHCLANRYVSLVVSVHCLYQSLQLNWSSLKVTSLWITVQRVHTLPYSSKLRRVQVFTEACSARHSCCGVHCVSVVVVLLVAVDLLLLLLAVAEVHVGATGRPIEGAGRAVPVKIRSLHGPNHVQL